MHGVHEFTPTEVVRARDGVRPLVSRDTGSGQQDWLSSRWQSHAAKRYRAQAHGQRYALDNDSNSAELYTPQRHPAPQAPAKCKDPNNKTLKSCVYLSGVSYWAGMAKRCFASSDFEIGFK